MVEVAFRVVDGDLGIEEVEDRLGKGFACWEVVEVEMLLLRVVVTCEVVVVTCIVLDRVVRALVVDR